MVPPSSWRVCVPQGRLQERRFVPAHAFLVNQLISCKDEYFADIATAYQDEIKDLYAAGCRHIQIDDPLLAYFCAESMIKGMEEQGIDHEALLDTYIKAYNDCLKARPDDMVVALHLCRGNFKVRRSIRSFVE